MEYLIIHHALDYNIQCRENMLALLQSLTFDEINKIPPGFNNNILWNAAHSIVTQQVLCYKLAGLDMMVDSSKIKQFMKGTKAEGKYDLSVLDFVVANAKELVEQLRSDYDTLDFSNFKEYSTSFGTTLKSIEDAIVFNNIHEGLHLGYMMAQKRTILGNK